MVFLQLGPRILGKLVDGMKAQNEDIVSQATFALANLSNGTSEQQDLLVRYPHLLETLQYCLSEGSASIRRPSVSCVLNLIKKNPRRRKDMLDAGIVATLKRICEWSGHAIGIPHKSYHSHGHSSSISGLSNLVAISGNHPAGLGLGQPSEGTVAPSTGTSAGAGTGTMQYGSWGGTGTMHQQYHSSHGYNASARAGAGITQGGNAPHSMVLDDDRDVVQNARVALGWLENGETYA